MAVDVSDPGTDISPPTFRPVLAIMAWGSAEVCPSTEIPRILKTSGRCWAYSDGREKTRTTRATLQFRNTFEKPFHIFQSAPLRLLKLFTDHSESPLSLLEVRNGGVEVLSAERRPELIRNVELSVGELP